MGARSKCHSLVDNLSSEPIDELTANWVNNEHKIVDYLKSNGALTFLFKKMRKLFVVVLLVFAVCNAKKYKPVVLLHGILTGNDSMMNIRDRILEVITKRSIFCFGQQTWRSVFRNTRVLWSTIPIVLAAGLAWKTCGIRFNN